MAETTIGDILITGINETIRVVEPKYTTSAKIISLNQTSPYEWEFTLENECGSPEDRVYFPVDFVSQRAYFANSERNRQVHQALNIFFDSNSTVQKSIPSTTRQFSSVEEFRQYFSLAYAKDMYRVFKLEKKKNSLLFGKLIRTIPGNNPSLPTTYIYQFASERQLTIPENSEATLYLSHLTFLGTILSSENLQVTLQTAVDLGEEVESLEMSIDLIWLTRRSEDSLRKICRNPSPMVKELILNGRSHTQTANSPLKVGQDQARAMISQNSISCIWGPPGTGKTTTLCHMVNDCFRQKRTVLVTAFSNAALDQALEKLIALYPSFLPGEIIRYGKPHYASIIHHPYLTPDNFIRYTDRKTFDALDTVSKLLQKANQLSKQKNKANQSKELEALQAEVKAFFEKAPNQPDAGELNLQLTSIRNSPSIKEIQDYLATQARILRAKIREEQKDAVIQARIVFATSSAVTSSEVIAHREFDTVFFDEISMATLPDVAIAADRAANHLVCLGDFNQLPPSKDEALQIDVFRYFGIVEALQQGRGHDWLVMLDTQYRMNSRVADFLSKNYYFNKLKTAPGVDERLKPTVQQSPFSGNKIILVDCSDFHTYCKVLSDHSRVNILSALLATGLALIASRTSTAAVISPYQAQSLMIQDIFRDLSRLNQIKGKKIEKMNDESVETSVESEDDQTVLQPSNSTLVTGDNTSGAVLEAFSTPALHEIKASTVHSFQGSESDVVILDLTDCYCAPYVSRLLSLHQNELANRLFNVSLSRTKAKLIVLVHRHYFNDKLNPVRKKSNKDSVLLLNKFFNWMDCNFNGDINLTEVSGSQLEQELKAITQLSSFLTPSNNQNSQPMFQYFDNKGRNWDIYLRDLQNAESQIRIDLAGKPTPNQNLYLIKMKEILARKKKEADFKVIIRASRIEDIPRQLKGFTVISQDATDPVTVIDKTITWYGMPRCNNAFHLKNGNEVASSRNPIFRIEGRFACYQIERILSMRDKEANRIHGLQEEFDAYLSNNVYCPECYAGMHVVIKDANIFLGCNNYPECKTTQSLSEEVVNDFVEKRKEPLICPICGNALSYKAQKVRGSERLLFVCSEDQTHNFTFAELI